MINIQLNGKYNWIKYDNINYEKEISDIISDERLNKKKIKQK